MIKYFFLFTIIVFFPFLTMGKNSATIKVSITIPRIAEMEQKPNTITPRQTNQSMLEETKETLRNKQRVILKTVVPK